jgi:hypothetical protein
MADIRALEELAKFLFISILIDREGFTSNQSGMNIFAGAEPSKCPERVSKPFESACIRSVRSSKLTWKVVSLDVSSRSQEEVIRTRTQRYRIRQE